MSSLPKLSRAARAVTDLDAKRNFSKLKPSITQKQERFVKDQSRQFAINQNNFLRF